MSQENQSVLFINSPTVPLAGSRAMFLEFMLIAAAIVLPTMAHLTGAPVRYLLPMHWPVILAGLVYGWRGGALTGVMAPIVSYSISGHPLPGILPSMTLELCTYGLAAGFLREKNGLNPWLSVALALVAGRIVVIASVTVGNAVVANLAGYFQASLLPGLVAGVAQIVLLPALANWWTSKERGDKNINPEKGVA
jgi:hypothetical protein